MSVFCQKFSFKRFGERLRADFSYYTHRLSSFMNIFRWLPVLHHIHVSLQWREDTGPDTCLSRCHAGLHSHSRTSVHLSEPLRPLFCQGLEKHSLKLVPRLSPTSYGSTLLHRPTFLEFSPLAASLAVMSCPQIVRDATCS